MAALRAHIDVAARQRQREAFERTLAGIVEEDRPALLEIAGADGDDARRIDAAEHRLSGDRDRLDPRLAGIAPHGELRPPTPRRSPVHPHTTPAPRHAPTHRARPRIGA